MNPPRKSSPHRTPVPKEDISLTLDYNHLGRLCLKYWRWLSGAVILGSVIGLLYAMSQTTIYSATSTILVEGKGTVEGVGVVTGPDMRSGDLIKTYEQMLQTRDLAARVVEAEKLNENPDFLGAGVTPPVDKEMAISMLNGSTSIRLRPLTRLIDISVEHHNPKMAKFLADRLAQESIDQAVDQSGKGVGVVATALQKEVDDLRVKLSDADNRVVDYEKTHKGGISLPQEVNLEEQRVKELNQRYVNAQAQLALLQQRYGPDHPKMIQAQQDVDELGQELNKAGVGTINRSSAEIEYNQIKTEADSLRLQLANMQKALQEALVSVHVNSPGISVAQTADLPGAPIRPSKSKSVAVGGFVGLMGGLCFILGVYFIDTSIRSVSQAESTLNVPVIAAVPILAQTERKYGLPTFSDPHSFVAESFRGLRASLLLHDRQNPLKTVLVGSAIPGEGKSFCAANLAVAFAQAGLKTLLIDADLRLPTAHTYFAVTQDERVSGFPTALTGKVSLESAVIPSQLPTLSLLMTTSPAESPAELLSGDLFARLLAEAALKYDRIVIDSAPLNAVSDTMLILPLTDAILLVVRAGQTPSSESKAALQKIYGSKMRPLGLILNYLAPHTLKAYSYGYSYGQKPPNKNAK